MERCLLTSESEICCPQRLCTCISCRRRLACKKVFHSKFNLLCSDLLSIIHGVSLCLGSDESGNVRRPPVQDQAKERVPRDLEIGDYPISATKAKTQINEPR